MTIAAINARYIQLVPSTPGEVPNGAFFLDSTDGNLPKVKEMGGSVEPITSGASNYFVKAMITDGAFPAGQPLAKKGNNRVVASDSDGVAGQQNQMGFALQESTGAGQTVNVLLNGPNLVGALTSLGFTPGQEVYLGENGGYVASVNAFQDADDRIIRLGIADGPAGADGGPATDLIAFTEVIVNP